jgi:transcription initiation factor TFIIF subunit beta
MLFRLFKEFEYYGIKDLVEKTKQPESHLKDILREIGEYSTADPHRNKWHLKREYQSYDN